MFSVELIEELKKAKGFSKDVQAAEAIPNLTRANISHIKSGSRHLTEEQALFIAKECNLSAEWVLVHLAEEVAKSEQAKEIWHNLAKKIKKSVSAAILALIVVFGGLNQNSEPNAFGV
jgi:plasmid maintenance system antidote protein VapI